MKLRVLILGTTLVFVINTIIFLYLYNATQLISFYSLTITFFTLLYHTIMRLVIGFAFDWFFPKNIKINNPRFCLSDFEKKIYKALQVRKWSKHVPAYYNEYYNIYNLALDDIIVNMSRAEIGHIVMCIFSFVPILFSIVAGKIWVFVITSLFAAVCDMVFVVVQRHNRDRVVKLVYRVNSVKS